MGKKQPQKKYVVKEIIDRKEQKTPKGSIITYYKVTWEGYPDQQATWEKALSLIKSPGVKKEIDNFNNKRKLIQKIKSPLLPNKKSKPNPGKQKITNSTKSLPKSMTQTKNKKQTISQNNQNDKVPKDIIVQVEATDQIPKTTQTSKIPEQKNNGVVNKILQKMREDLTHKKQQKKINNAEKITELGQKLKDKVKTMPKNKKSTKQKAKITPEKILQSKLKSSQIPMPIIEQKNAQINTVPSQPIPQNQTAIQTGASFQQNLNPLLTMSCVDRIIDQIIEEKTSQQKQLQKPNDEKSAISEKIKLELTDQFTDNISFKGKQSLVGPEIPNGSFQSSEFVIKGMMVSKNEYFYLVEQNGKSEILSRAVMLDKYPYQLIVFYEKRINIKPAEINLMVV